jgi:hypothetical protein
MTKSPAEIRFENARENLSRALQNLEETALQKIHEATLNTNIIDAKSSDSAHLRSQIAEQDSVIYTLKCEINNLQNNLSQLGDEIENLAEENRNLVNKIQKIHREGNETIEEIAKDIQIIEVMLNHDN